MEGGTGKEPRLSQRDGVPWRIMMIACQCDWPGLRASNETRARHATDRISAAALARPGSLTSRLKVNLARWDRMDRS